MKPMPYCTPLMLSDLKQAKQLSLGRLPGYDSARWWSLKSRGWIDWQGVITQRGLQYLFNRGIQ